MWDFNLAARTYRLTMWCPTAPLTPIVVSVPYCYASSLPICRNDYLGVYSRTTELCIRYISPTFRIMSGITLLGMPGLTSRPRLCNYIGPPADDIERVTQVHALLAAYDPVPSTLRQKSYYTVVTPLLQISTTP